MDARELYYRVNYEKSEIEMRLIADACVIGDAMLRAMLAVLRPGRLKTKLRLGVLGWPHAGFRAIWPSRLSTGLPCTMPLLCALSSASAISIAH